MAVRDHHWPKATPKLYRPVGEKQKCSRCGALREWSRIGDRWLHARAEGLPFIKAPISCGENR